MRKGITLVEATIGVALSGVLVLTVFVALSAGAQVSGKTTTLTQMRRDARYAFMHMEKRVRPCKGTEVAVNGAADKLTITPGGATASYYQKSGSTLIFFDGPGNKTITLVPSGVSSVLFAVNAGERAGTNLVSANLTLAQGVTTTSMASVIELRNQ